MKEDLINTIIKMFSINTFTFYIFFKMINNQKNNLCRHIFIIIISLLLSILYVTVKGYINNIFIIVLLCFIQVIILKIVLEEKHYSVITAVFISNAIAYVIFVIATIIETIPKYALKLENSIINFFVISIIGGMILLGLMKIKRVKNGMNFLSKKTQNDYINLIIINISATIILSYSTFKKYNGYALMRHKIITFITLVILTAIVIQKTLTMYYKQKLLDDTIKQYEKDLREKDAKIEVLSREKFLISKINHEFFNRQEALLLRVNELSGMSLDVADELDVSDRVQRLSNEFSRSMESIRCVPSLPKSDIPEIDDMFKYMQSECLKNNIDFKLQVNGNIHHLVNSFIPKSKLETLVGDILRDAIRAVFSSSGDYKSIFAILGLKDNFYEFCVFDSGVDFEIDTLIKLGLECVTTHKDNGGSGIGFITTFETMNECNASLVIEEFPNDSKNDYSKSITVRFDGKNEYRIVSYRANEIKEKSKDNRIIIDEK